MAALTYNETDSMNLSSLPLVEGQIIYLFDTGEAYYDINGGTRLKTTAVVWLATEEERLNYSNPDSYTIYCPLDSKSFYRHDSFRGWYLVDQTTDIEDILEIYDKMILGTITKGSGTQQQLYAPRGLARGIYTDNGVTVEDILKTLTRLGTGTATVTATQAGQKSFNIPYPFENYDTGGNTFMVFIGTTFVANNRYTVNGDILTFIDDTAVQNGRTVTFVFLYNSKHPLTTELVNPYMDGKYIAKGTIPIDRMERRSSALTDNDIGAVATSAAVARLYENILTKLEALGSPQARYIQAGGDGLNITAHAPSYVLRDFDIIHLRMNTSIKQDATLSVNGGEAIPIYMDFYNRIIGGAVYPNEVISLFYNDQEKRFYAFTGLPFHITTSELVYTTVEDGEVNFNYEALDFDYMMDHLTVYQDGIRLVNNYNYRDNYNGSISLLGYTAKKNTEFTFLATRLSRMGVGVPSGASTTYVEPDENPGGSGTVYNPIDDDQGQNETFVSGNWSIYSDNLGSNNLMFLYNDVLKVVMTPTGQVIANEFREEDV